MELFVFQHEPSVKAGCCNWETSATYWMAASREAAEQEIREHTDDGDEPHGLCPNCLVEVLMSGDYSIFKRDEDTVQEMHLAVDTHGLAELHLLDTGESFERDVAEIANIVNRELGRHSFEVET